MQEQTFQVSNTEIAEATYLDSNQKWNQQFFQMSNTKGDKASYLDNCQSEINSPHLVIGNKPQKYFSEVIYIYWETKTMEER